VSRTRDNGLVLTGAKAQSTKEENKEIARAYPPAATTKTCQSPKSCKSASGSVSGGHLMMTMMMSSCQSACDVISASVGQSPDGEGGDGEALEVPVTTDPAQLDPYYLQDDVMMMMMMMMMTTMMILSCQS
jgi:hypothetical protein